MTSASLLRWYDANKRDLPWRKTKEPYRIWLSEIMLQQTAVATVIPYYERFLARFPTLNSLAAADEAEVLRLWAGLGYYSRAKNFLRAAKETGGQIPSDPEALRRLPGIGRYTAGAIASIAFGKPVPLVDGNVIRVFARLFAVHGDIKSPALQERIWALAEKHLDRTRPGDWNQALMELGATVCVPTLPACSSCPAASVCLAKAQGLQASLPTPAKRRTPIKLAWTALLARRQGSVLLWRRGTDERFLPGHWALPEARHLPRAIPGKVLRRVNHSITHHRITVAVRQAEAPLRLPKSARWVPESSVSGLLVSSLWRKALNDLDTAGRKEH